MKIKSQWKSIPNKFRDQLEEFDPKTDSSDFVFCEWILQTGLAEQDPLIHAAMDRICPDMEANPDQELRVRIISYAKTLLKKEREANLKFVEGL